MAATSKRTSRPQISRILAWLLSRLDGIPAGRFASQKNAGRSLTALTIAALALPGMTPRQSGAVEDDGVDFQYSRYREGDRDMYRYHFGEGYVYKLPNKLEPIEVDGLHAKARLRLSDRFKLKFNFIQDTWSGASPIGSAPVISGGGNGPTYAEDGTTITGASPLASLPMYGDLAVDRDGNFYEYQTDPNTGQRIIGARNNRHTHVMSSASPETRKQGDFKLTYEWNEAALDVGAGTSTERDYRSQFFNLGGRLDFNQKLTTFNWGLSYTSSETKAKLDPDALPFIATDLYDKSLCFSDGTLIPMQPTVPTGYVEGNCVDDGQGQFVRTEATLRGKRQDRGIELGLTQVLNKNALLTLGLGYTRSTGYMANPYKVVFGHTVVFNVNNDDDPIGQTNLYGNTGSSALVEVRPEKRELFDWHLGYKRYVESLDAALHLDYHYAHDDWGIRAHTLEGKWVQPFGTGWTVTPRLRYYSQSQADFYATAIFEMTRYNFDASGAFVDTTSLRKFPKHYSSDQRLSGYGTLGAGFSLSKRFARGVTAEAGYDYYTHKGSLKLGGGGEDDFADFHYWVANAAIKVDLDAVGGSRGDPQPQQHDAHSQHQHSSAPAGVMFDHALGKAGEFMLGYRYMRSTQGGGLLFGSNSVNVDTVRQAGCESQECAVTPRAMSMNMHMLDLMYAPKDWLTLTLMPQWVDMSMSMTPNPNVQLSGAHGAHSTGHRHETGGMGDTGIYAIAKLLDKPGHHLNLALGATIPTGDVDIRLRKTLTTPVYDQRIHYGMQLGSGTWDLQPSLTYTGEAGRLSWGAQLTGTARMEKRNDSGFAFGDIFQSSVWGGVRWTPWLTGTLRGVYTTQGRLRGRYPASEEIDIYTGELFVPEHLGPFDFPSNYGGKFVDIGVGLNATLGGAWRGSNLKLEWLQPVREKVNGYQQERESTWVFSWNMQF